MRFSTAIAVRNLAIVAPMMACAIIALSVDVEAWQDTSTAWPNEATVGTIPGRPRPPAFWPFPQTKGNSVPQAVRMANPAQAASVHSGVQQATPVVYLEPLPDASYSAEASLAPFLQRLQRLGAQHYRLLELRPGQYRFDCRVAHAANPNYYRYFSAASGQPAVAVRQVLEQVEAWYSRW